MIKTDNSKISITPLNRSNDNDDNDAADDYENDCDYAWNKHDTASNPSLTNLRIHICKQYFSCANICMICLIVLLVFFAMATTYYAWYYYIPHNLYAPATVDLLCGQVEALEQNDSIHYLGIPYALPPLGLRRFQSPVEISGQHMCSQVWREPIYKANQAKPPCLQLEPRTNKIIGSEDCLYLNVHIPKWKSKPYQSLVSPVIVIFDGLLFLYQTSSSNKVDAKTLHHTQSIHVTFNYRIGALGFLTNPLTNQSNLGIQDQLAVLKWIRSNIAYFGGDPGNVILFGYGSGATCALALFYSPVGHSLFDKLWITGPGLISPSTDVAEALTYSSRMVQCTSALQHELETQTCLSKAFDDNQKLINLWNWDFVTKWLEQDLINFPKFMLDHKHLSQVVPFLVNDGKLININFWHNPMHSKPIIIGQTSHEASIFPKPSTIHFWSKQDVFDYVMSKISKFIDNVNRISKVYFNETVGEHQCLSQTDQTAFSSEFDLMKILTDCRFTCPIFNLTQYLTLKQSADVYQYYLLGNHRLFDPYGFGAFGSHTFHGWDGMLYLRAYEHHSDFNHPTFHHYDLDIDELQRTSQLFNEIMFEFAHYGHVKTWAKTLLNEHVINVIRKGRMCPQSHLVEFRRRCEFWKSIFGGHLLINGSWKY